ncbi:MAG TPA: Uma2 family endonuclease [Edaphobacter sp.]|nr:Uma2 family endonuclease [Edaphobacter sp.]
MSTLLPVDVRFAARTLVLDPPMTDAEFEELCRANDNVQFERTREGVIQMNPPAGGLTSDGNAEIIWQLRDWWKSHRRGKVFDSNGGFYLADGSMLSPDAAYVSVEKLNGLTKDQLTGFPRLCPDFVIELLSVSDSLASTQEKMERWIENGAKLGWLIDPYVQKVYVYAPGLPPASVAEACINGAGPVEGFELDLQEIWRCYEV